MVLGGSRKAEYPQAQILERVSSYLRMVLLCCLREQGQRVVSLNGSTK
jgi:hypothetical protein